MKADFRPIAIGRERRLVLGRFIWEHGTVGDGRGYSAKVSLSLCFEPHDIWVGLHWKQTGYEEQTFWLALLPCLPLRIHFIRAYGGRFA